TDCLSTPTQPNLTLTIENTDGTVFQTYNTNTIGSLPSPEWQQFGFFFTTPANVTDVVVRIFNNAPGGCGNDLALDDITFRPCGPTVTAGLGATNDTSLNVCDGDTISYLIHGTYSTGYDHPVFQWQVKTNGGSWTDI